MDAGGATVIKERDSVERTVAAKSEANVAVAFKKARRVATFFNKSPQAQDRLKKCRAILRATDPSIPEETIKQARIKFDRSMFIFVSPFQCLAL
jgi:hypothetical protein